MKEDGPLIGNATPIVTAQLTVGDVDVTKPAESGATHVEMTVQLEAGRTKLKTLFHDKTGKVLCSAYYVQVERIGD